MNPLDKLATVIMQSQKPKGTKPYDATAKVVRVDGDTAYVHIPGGVDETPARMTVNARKGDTVRVRISGSRAHVIGNASAPPTDDTKAVTADEKAVKAQTEADRASAEAMKAKGRADSAHAAADTAGKVAKDASRTASEAHKIAGNTNQYFWVTQEGTDTGAHITEKTQEAFLDDPTGGNLLARSNGIAVRDGLTELAVFGADGARIGQTSDNNIKVESDKFSFNSSETEIAKITSEVITVNSTPVAITAHLESQTDDTDCDLQLQNPLSGTARNAEVALWCGGRTDLGDSYPASQVVLHRSVTNATAKIEADHKSGKQSYVSLGASSTKSSVTIKGDEIKLDGDVIMSIDNTSTDTTSPDYKLYHALSDMGWL